MATQKKEKEPELKPLKSLIWKIKKKILPVVQKPASVIEVPKVIPIMQVPVIDWYLTPLVQNYLRS